MPRSFVDLDLEPLNCVDGDVRLVNSNTSQEGRLQVCFNRVWGTVCNDRFDSDDARVVCSQLSTQFEGPSTQTSAGVFTVSPFAGGEVLTGADSYGPGSGPVFIETLTCEGDEGSILECRDVNLRRQSCAHDRDVSIRCIGQTKSPQSNRQELFRCSCQ